MDFHTIKIWQAFRRSVPFWKIFGNRRRLVWRSYSWFDMTRLYTQWLRAYQQKDRLSHLIQNLTSLSAFGSILKVFEGTVSVDVRIILLVEDDTTLYTMVTSVSTKRWTLTFYPTFDEPFGVWFHLENFLENRHRLMWGSYFWLDMTRLCTRRVRTY